MGRAFRDGRRRERLAALSVLRESPGGLGEREGPSPDAPGRAYRYRRPLLPDENLTEESPPVKAAEPRHSSRGREIQPADPAARRRAAILLLVLAASGGLAVWWTQARLEELRAIAEQDPVKAADELVRLVRFFALAMPAPLLGFACYGYWIAYRVYAGGRFPPAGMAVVRDTPVIRGPGALSRARFLAVLMTALLAASIALPVTLMRAVALLQEAAHRQNYGGRGGDCSPPAPTFVKHKGEGALHEGMFRVGTSPQRELARGL